MPKEKILAKTKMKRNNRVKMGGKSLHELDMTFVRYDNAQTGYSRSLLSKHL